MNKLEVEYDYETDEDQQERSHLMLIQELSAAIDFYVRDDPIKLVENVLLWVRPIPMFEQRRFSLSLIPVINLTLRPIPLFFTLIKPLILLFKFYH